MNRSAWVDLFFLALNIIRFKIFIHNFFYEKFNNKKFSLLIK